MVEQVSLYFHIPFCTRKCDYCHFYVLPDQTLLKQALMRGLKLEWALYKPMIQGKEVFSIYFGGGTPSLLGADAIFEILSWVKESGSLDPSIEITLEANPEHLTLDLLTQYKSVGINRLSIGVQTFDDRLLKRIGRTHLAKEAINGVQNAYKSGLTNLSIDLMYDLPDQTLSSWKESVDIALTLPLTHISLYNLTIEPNTLFFKKRKEIQKAQCEEEVSLQMYEYAIEQLTNHRFHQYEISAFAKYGFESKHNSGYWMGRAFLGFGPSAFSYWEGRRFRNICNLSKYVKLLSSGQSPVDFEERLEKDAHQKELLAIQLRLTSGVNLSQFEQKYGPLPQETKDTLEKLILEQFLEQKDHFLCLTRKGILFYDTVAVELI